MHGVHVRVTDFVTGSICASRTIAQKMNWSLVCSTSRLASIARRHACTKAFEPLVARKCTTPVLSSALSLIHI